MKAGSLSKLLYFCFVCIVAVAGGFSARSLGRHLQDVAPSSGEQRNFAAQPTSHESISNVTNSLQLHEALRNLTTYIEIQAYIRLWGRLVIPEQTHAIIVRCTLSYMQRLGLLACSACPRPNE